MKDSPLPILIILIIILGLAYEPIKKADHTSGRPTNSGSSIGNGSQSLGYSSNKELAENIKDVEENLERLEQNIQKQIAETKRSPYYNKIRMSGVSGIYGDDPNREFIELYTNLEKNETINITGWYFKSEVTGYYATIGKASLLPFPFTKAESDVVLQRGDRAIITKGFSPIGISFRTNKCTGFFEENRRFTPSLPRQCPEPEDEKLPRFSTDLDRQDECIDLIERVPRCTTVGNEFTRKLPDTVPTSCKNYLKTQINYNSCVALHFGDTDFPGNQYRVYLNKFGPLWRKEREKINLHDRNGLIVDTVSY
jgi:hypothetical protein